MSGHWRQTTTECLIPARYSMEWRESVTLAGSLRMLQWPGGKELSSCQCGVLPPFILSLFKFP